MTEQSQEQQVLVPVDKPFSLIPVGLKEAALDSPTFRATAIHVADQVDVVERWLDSYAKSASRLIHEVGPFEALVHALLTSAVAPSQLSEAILDHDYTMLAMQRFGDGAREFWTHIIANVKNINVTAVEPIRAFLTSDVRAFKDSRRSLDATQKVYDGLLSRYYGQAKSKEPSSLREDAFQLHEAKRAYLKASMDFSVLAPQLGAALDALLVKVFSEQWLDMKETRDASPLFSAKQATELARIREWSKDTSEGERFSRYELIAARKEIEETALNAARPQRDLDYYSASTVPYLGSRPRAVATSSAEGAHSSKQGWVFLRTLSGKPSRTTWIRRWIFVNHGIFGWLVQGARSGGVEESEKIGVLLCNVRPAFQEERRFCFEVKTKDTTVLLQAESQTDLTQWIEVFDVAKQRALEEPAAGDSLASGTNPASDAAFAVSPAVAPELATKRADGHVTNIAEEVQGSAHLSEPESGLGLVSRHSIDVNQLKKSGEKNEGERNRDHAARLIQKLDLHRKTSAGSQVTPAPSSPLPGTPGIATLIHSSHAALPVGPARAETFPAATTEKKDTTSDSHMPSGLAPTSLANPPAPTNLSKTAVKIGAERGLDLGVVDKAGGVPSSIMANQWGTLNYGHVSRVERGEVKPSPEKSAPNSSTATTPNMRGFSDPPLPSDAFESLPQSIPSFHLLPQASSGRVRSGSASLHHKSASEVDINLPRRRPQSGHADFPGFYPQDMKPHDAQFRMLFPNVPIDDRVVLVFRASWNPEDRQDLPGRVFVTQNHIYFYSNHYGFVLVSGVDLSTILGVYSTRAQGHDLLHLRIEGRNGLGETNVMTVKTFLEPIKLLERRLNFLASNCASEEPEDLKEVIHVLQKLETEHGYETHDSGEDSPPEPGAAPAKSPERKQTMSLKVDRSLNYGGDQATLPDLHEAIKFRLPTQPVIYAPKHMDDLAAEGIFDVSAKALFHIMFGDKSVISQMLYRERRAEAVKQLPWTKDSQGRWNRTFEHETNAVDSLRRVRKVSVVDRQTVEVANDHLCYVVADSKTPWHLPYANDFLMVTTVVITHLAKSKSSLRIFTKVQWTQTPPFYKKVVRKHAIHDMRLDGQDLLDLVSDQVQKLGPDCTTKRAIHIFGHIGHQNEAAVITSADPSVLGRPIRAVIERRGLVYLVFEIISSFVASAVSTVLMSIIGATRGLVSLLTTHTLICFLLLASAAINLMSSSQVASTWWRDYKAASFMSRVGVGPNTSLSKTIYLSDLNEIVSVRSDPVGQPNSKCSTAFQDILTHTDLDASVDGSSARYTASSTKSTARRLRRTRQRMGAYRHDLMVALRLVNGIEREAIEAEYDNWLLDENTRCRQIESLLLETTADKGSDGMSVTAAPNQANSSQSQSQSKLAQKLGGSDAVQVRSWYDEYCLSCYRELDAIEAKHRERLK